MATASATLMASSSCFRLTHFTSSSSSSKFRVNFAPSSLPAKSLKLSSSHCISSFLPVKPASATTTPAISRSQKFSISAHKGYKMKTHKASAKRFRVTGRGKIVRRCAGKQHLLVKKNAKRRNRLSKSVQVSRSDYDNVIGALPYLKVNRNAT